MREPKVDREWYVLTVALAATLIAVVAYIFIFRDLPLGGPTAWAEFGDFFGGVINPIVGLATVLLVVQTLRVTRQEAAEQRKLLQHQINDASKQQVLDEHLKRLDRMLAAWSDLMMVKPRMGYLDGTGSARYFSGYTLGEAFATKELNLYVEQIAEAGQVPVSDTLGDLQPVRAFLEELAQYLVEYDQATRTHILTTYYRHRVASTAYAMYWLGALDRTTLDRVCLDPEDHPGFI